MCPFGWIVYPERDVSLFILSSIRSDRTSFFSPSFFYLEISHICLSVFRDEFELEAERGVGLRSETDRQKRKLKYQWRKRRLI